MRAVLDANVIVRSFLDQGSAAAQWVARLDERDFAAYAPDHLFAEVGQALLGYLRSGVLRVDQAGEYLAFVGALPLQVRSTRELVGSALGAGSARQLSVYDACYAVLAEAEDAVLVTADRRLAAAVSRSELL